MWTDRLWNIRTNEQFNEWINQQNVVWVAVTFTGRKRPIQYKHSDVDLIDAELISKDSIGTSFSKQDVELGFAKTVKHLDFKYISTSQRKRGRKILRVPFHGGNNETGVWNHIHAFIELPTSESIENFRIYMNKIFKKKMEAISGKMTSRTVITNVWCAPYRHDESKYLKYCLRHEGEPLAVQFDKVIVSQLVLSPTGI